MFISILTVGGLFESEGISLLEENTYKIWSLLYNMYIKDVLCGLPILRRSKRSIKCPLFSPGTKH